MNMSAYLNEQNMRGMTYFDHQVKEEMEHAAKIKLSSGNRIL